MSDETSNGASYLSALKRSASPTGAAAARGPSPAPSAETRPASEKRRSPRYRCQGSAHLREISSGVATWATFTDISLHGCYVEATATYQLGASVAMTIEINNFRVETTGEVRVAYPSLGMGIVFTDISGENRARLRELLRSLSRPSVIVGPGTPLQNTSVLPMEALPPVTNARAAMEAMVSFFESRQLLTREEFLRILRKSQKPEG
jgi:PilZ domain